MSKCFLIRYYLALLLLFSASNVFAATTDPLIQQSNLQYIGAFKVPSGQFGSGGNATFDYSDDGLAFNPINNSLLIKGHTYGQMVAEISIPQIVNSTNLNSLNTATMLQNFSDITEGNLNQQNIANGMILGGLMVYGTKLIGSEWAFYDGSTQQTKSHFTSGLTLGTTGDYRGMYTVGSLFPAFVGGYMTTIPSEWQAALGGPALTGHCCTSIISHQSLGPSASVFDPNNLGAQNPVPAIPLVNYNLAHPTLGTWDHPLPANPIYNISTLITGVVFPQGTRSILFFGRTGMGAQCYGTGGASGGDCTDPADPYKGTHAFPYSYYVWMYDANDFVAVRNGTKNPWDITPYYHGAISLPFTNTNGNNQLNGAAYDPATNRLYLAQKCVVGSCAPLIHVFVVNVGTAPTAGPTVAISANPTSITSGGSSTLSWTSTNATSCTASGAWSGTKATSGSQSTGNLTATATYSLACTGAGGSATQSATLTVTPPPTVPTAVPTVTISASPSSIISASSSTLSWSSTNATSCTASGAWSATKATSGSQSTGTLSANATYTLTCTGAGGSASQSATVTVTPPSTAPPPSSSVNVSNVSGLQSAIAGLTSNVTILLADGTYNLTDTLYLPQNISNVTIKGASGNRDAVIIKGPGMTNSAIAFGFWADNVSGITFQDITIRDFNQHAIILNGGVDSPVYRNLHIVDIGDQFLKNNPTPDQLSGIDNGILENSLLEYSSVAPDTYTNGLDVHRGENWIVRDNTFKNFRSTAGLAGPAVLIWNGSSDTTVVRNTFINNQRDISLGLDPTKPAGGVTDHARGLIANNFIYKTSATTPDVPVAVFDSPQTKVYYNTILLNGSYPNAIEYRFARTTGIDIKNNLTDASIVARDGASGSANNNITNATTAMFVNPADGDLHLKQTATAAIDNGIAVSVTDDFDNQARPQGAASDIGADEYVTSTISPAAPNNLVLQ
jgi:hypothetical protein